jgi:quercetin dioxygenase-like cupin family protein
MIIKEMLSQLESADAPVIKVLKSYTAGKALALVLKKGMILKEHKTAIPGKLVVMDGAVTYKQEGKSVTLNKFSDLDIPVDVLHSLEAEQDSVCLVVLG